MTAYDRVVQALDKHGLTIRGEMAVCPAHDDQKPSLHITPKPDRVLLSCQAGCDTADVIDKLGLTWSDLFDQERPHDDRWLPRGLIFDCAYDYTDETGRLLYQVIRAVPKDFVQRRPDPARRSGWGWKLGATRRVLYRLPKVVKAIEAGQPIWLVDGEKDVHSLERAGVTATTNPMGGGPGKWKPGYTATLKGAHVVLVADRDEPGRAHAARVARALQPVAKSLRVVEAAEGKDATDHLNANHTLDQFVDINPEPADPGAGIEDDDHGVTDMRNARRLVDAHGHEIRWVAAWRTWLAWDGRRWAKDSDGAVVRMAEAVVERMRDDAEPMKDDQKKRYLAAVTRAESHGRLEAMIALARSEPGITIQPDRLDADPYALNCLNGTIDLRTGHLRPPNPADLHTKLAPVAYNRDANHPTWDTYLQTATGGDADYQQFLQRATGYSITGDTSEEKLFFIYGPTRTGKTTFTEALKATLGDYAETANFETFLARPYDGGPRNDIAALAGARLVVSVEVEEGKRLAEGLVKMLTGGETVSARFLYAEAFTFKPAFKLWLAANHTPRVRDDDDAIWERILRLPFPHTVPPDKRDPQVKNTLRNPAEAGPAILAWAVAGCLAWQAQGLNPPTAVTESTAAYRADMDPLREFLADRTILHPDAHVTVPNLRKTYEAWCDEAGQKYPLAPRGFNERLEAAGCRQDRIRIGGHQQRVWRGIGIRADEEFTETPSQPSQPSQQPSLTSECDSKTACDNESGNSPHPRAHDAHVLVDTHAPATRADALRTRRGTELPENPSQPSQPSQPWWNNDGESPTIQTAEPDPPAPWTTEQLTNLALERARRRP